MIKTHTTQRGFTLIETEVTLFIFTLLVAGVSVLFINIFTAPTQERLAIDSAEQARKVIYNFTNEVRTATNGNDGSYSITRADDNQIILYTNYKATGANVNRVRYFIASSTLYKGITVPTGTPLSYNLGSEKIYAVQAGLTATTSPIFFYYNGTYAGTTTPLAQPVNINNVKFIKMNLKVLNRDLKKGTSIFQISAGATIRNLKNNLGN